MNDELNEEERLFLGSMSKIEHDILIGQVLNNHFLSAKPIEEVYLVCLKAKLNYTKVYTKALDERKQLGNTNTLPSQNNSSMPSF